MDPVLRSRLLRLNAGLLLPDQAVWLACDLLLAGYETPALVELAGESPTDLRGCDAEALADRVLAELGTSRLSEEESNWVECRDLALDVISGEVSPDDWAYRLVPLRELGDADELDELRMIAIHDPAAVADRVLRFAHECVRIVDARLTGW
ncbi:hypothetical protein [Lentzea flava]|uniref:Uncharacterized protein n=1 Tax=Lentzea flava TaxID=103732 RepID=A0ABQ2UE73_9PSEU|nr:hypothetical protein [Lentzea flava]MCP2197610.1 hypothetical protein [Lentzea flava]GGU20877.1 hypothetical protein GCM10010178_11360 [Lentzea flava]